MQQIAQTWNALNARKQIIVIVATAAMFASVYFLVRLAAQPSMALLYSGLESGPAGDVVRALEQRGVVYDVRGGAIFVPGSQRDELRLTLASEGLPANSSKGYELLDSLTGFGTTSQMFDAAYWRAKEGELARTILATPEIRSARVHIANASSNPFQRDLRPSASIAVTSSTGGVSAAQARAFKFLVASAVAGLDPNDVAVIDGNGGLVTSGEEAAAIGSANRGQRMREQVLRLLEARLGQGNAVVEVSVETETETEAIRERIVDPESRVAISTDTEERINTASDSGGGGEVTVASNLPDGDAAAGSSNSQNNETRERVNYEVSQTEREIMRAPGAIKRLSVAVLVNGTPSTGADGAQVLEPLPESELSALRELVASAVGLDEARGDSLTIKSMPFTPVGTEGTIATGGLFEGVALDIMSIIQMVVVALVALVLGLGVVRPLLSGKAEAEVPALPAASTTPVGDPVFDDASLAPALMGEIDVGDGEFSPILPQTADPSEIDFDTSDPVERLRNLISERQEETVEVLRGWLDEKGERV